MLVFVILVMGSCVTKKKKGEISKAAKFYHNTTAKYNGYFNADELLQASIDKLKTQQEDNFNEILPIYEEMAVEKPELVSEDLNKAIEKVSIVATVHEPSKWVDDCYILIGQAQYLQQDFETAEETFEYFIEEFDPSNTIRKLRKSKSKASKKDKERARKKELREKRKARKKKIRDRKKKKSKRNKETKAEKEARLAKEKLEAERKEAEEAALEGTMKIDRGNGVFKHQNAFPLGLLWLARTYVEREKYNLVDFYLNKITEQQEVSSQVLKEIPVVKAYSALDQKKYSEAITHLGEAIPLEKNKFRKARLIYIQSQLYQELGNQSLAFAGFNEVIDMKPEFIMEFNAGLNMLKNSMGNDNASINKVKKELERMLKEEKYNQFKDQIYFTLGEIYFNANDIKNAVPNYRKSIKYNSGNNAQLVESYYVLAKIFYDKEDYVMSKNYYDSTSTVILKNDDRFFEVERFSNNLEDIAKNITTIQLQDSLIMLAGLTDEERAEIAAEIRKKQLIEEAKSKEDDDVAVAGSNNRMRNIPASRVGGRTSTFFAYDDTKKQLGKREFNRVWGSRVLEDDWRRSTKPNAAIAIQDISSDDKLELTNEEVREIMKDVPLTADAMQASKEKIRNALFELGILYREKIENYTKAVESHEELQERFPGSENEVDALYYLYLSYLDLNNDSKAQYYLNQLKSKYPDEKYTLALTDPAYVDNFLKESKIQENLYNETYSKFSAGDYTAVLSMEKRAKEKFTDNNTFESKYALLSAMATGKISGKEEYISALKNMIATYPNTPEQTRAKEILRFLRGDEEAFADIDANEAVQDFKSDDDKLHYVIVVISSKTDSDLNAAKISVSNYNRKYHKVDKIRISSSTLNKENNTQVVLLRRFDNKEAAMKYYNEVTRNDDEFMETKMSYDVFPITQQNFREIMKKKSIKEYEVFFKENYLL